MGICLYDTRASDVVQSATFRGRDHYPVHPLVPAVSADFRGLEEILAERNLSVDHVTIWRWVQRYAPELNRRCRPELRNTTGRGHQSTPLETRPTSIWDTYFCTIILTALLQT